jgi:hypothetical protein
VVGVVNRENQVSIGIHVTYFEHEWLLQRVSTPGKALELGRTFLPKQLKPAYSRQLFLDMPDLIEDCRFKTFFVRHCQNLRIFSYVNGF